MATVADRNNREQKTPTRVAPELAEKLASCQKLGEALTKGDMGCIVAEHEKLILEYYGDVKNQADLSFRSAQKVAMIGFVVLIGTLVCLFISDLLTPNQPNDGRGPISVATLGLVSGALIEFIAAINFWMYGRSSKQFSAFHICLERTHRYLVAFSIAASMGKKKDVTLGQLVCIMAKAPMITRQDIDAVGAEPRIPHTFLAKSAPAKTPNGATGVIAAVP